MCAARKRDGGLRNKRRASIQERRQPGFSPGG